jgi:hypothetical protein
MPADLLGEGWSPLEIGGPMNELGADTLQLAGVRGSVRRTAEARQIFFAAHFH